jgi:hypothetical protein
VREQRCPPVVLYPFHAQALDASLKEIEPPRSRQSWYDYDSRTIVLVRGYGDNAAAFCHELGHHISLHWPAGVWPAWEAFWKAHLAEMPSKYAKTSAAEGAAEAFSFYMVKPRQLKPAVAEWLKAQGL